MNKAKGSAAEATKLMYQIEAHLTRDFMERMGGSLNLSSYSGGKATIDGVEGMKRLKGYE